MTLTPTQAKNILCALDKTGKAELAEVAVAAGPEFEQGLSRFARDSFGMDLDAQKAQVDGLCTKYLGEGVLKAVTLKKEAPATVVLDVKSLEALAAGPAGEKGGR
jgi:hypothetical protein